MPASISRKEVITILEKIGLLLELKGENPFKSKAYYKAAQILESADIDLEAAIREGSLSSIKGIGQALSQKITELVTTGELGYYNTLKKSIPSGLLEMLRIPGLGPKKIHTLYEKLRIENIGQLVYACQENRLLDLPGFGKKTQHNILQGLKNLRSYQNKHLFSDAFAEAEILLDILRHHQDILSATLAGSLRRCCEVVKDIDIVISTLKPSEIATFFAGLPSVAAIIAKGTTKVSVNLQSGMQVDLRLVTEEQYPYALHHFTGSKEHNTAMRGRAKNLHLKMNEYGLFRDDNSNIPCRSEEELFQALGLAFIPPELRENRGEIEAAENNSLPDLVTLQDIKGLLHIHTKASDGSDSLEAVAHTAREMGMHYIGISEHSQSARYAGGLTTAEIIEQHRQIDLLNTRWPDFRIFKGIEVDILPDGSLDYENRILDLFDFVIIAVHTHFSMPQEAMTARIIKAMDNPHATILAHPSGRLLLAREPYAINMKEIIDHAALRGTIIELNANPQRLDIDWRHCQYAKSRGVKFALNPDAHNIAGLQHIIFGVNIARKGWLTPDDCINTLPGEELANLFLS